MEYAVATRGLTKGYTRGAHRVEVLRDVDVNVPAGEFLALLGPSGSGKTTLLNLIGGLDQVDSGEISVAGERLDRLPKSRLERWRARHVGFVFQFYNLLPALSAARNVEVPLLLTTLSRKQRESSIAVALDLVGLRDRASHRPSELSGGQQQRVAIARAIVADPTILVCDEPTGDLDRQTSESILDLLQHLSREQRKTIIMVTHDPLAAARASRQLHVDKGRLVSAREIEAAA